MNQLDHLLNAWAERQQPTPTELKALHSQIATALATGGDQVSESPPVLRCSRTSADVRSLGRAAIAVVAASLLAMVFVVAMSPRGERFSSHELSLTLLPSNERPGQQTLFDELNRMFNGRWRWLSEVNGRVHVETEDSTFPTSTDSGIAVRLAIVQRRPSQSEWTLIWEASVLARPEEWVRLPVDLTGSDAISLWAFALPDGSMLVENDVSLSSPVAVRLSEPRVFSASAQPARLWSARRSDGDFQLIQFITRLEGHHG